MTKWSVEQNILYNTDGTWSRNRRPTVLCGGFTVGAAALATWLAAWLSTETTMRMITWSQSCDWQSKTLFVLISWQVLLLTDRVERASEVPAVGGNTHPQRGNRLRQNTGGLHWVKAVCSFLFYLGFSIARLRLLRQWFSLFRSAAFPQLFQLFHRHLGLATEENNASSCWRWQMRSLRAVVRPLSIKVKKRARRRFIGDRPCCQLSALCNLNLLQNDNVKAEKVFHCQFSERREVKETVNH